MAKLDSGCADTHRLATSLTPISLGIKTIISPVHLMPHPSTISKTHFFNKPSITLTLLCSPAPVSGSTAGPPSSSVRMTGAMSQSDRRKKEHEAARRECALDHGDDEIWIIQLTRIILCRNSRY